MGKEVVNIELVVDYSTQESVFRVHLDTVIPNDKVKELGDCLEKNNFDAVKSVLSDIAPSHNMAIINSVMNIMKKDKTILGPAPYYKWKSKVDEKIICQQTSPGDGWEQIAGPYKDSHCKIRKPQ